MSRATPIRLDLQQPGAPLRRTGWVLFMAGVLAAVGVGYLFRNAIDERAALDDQFTALSAKQRPPVATGDTSEWL